MGRFSQAIESIEALEAHYGKVSPLALGKVCDHITALYQRWIKTSRFMILSTVRPGGTDASTKLPTAGEFLHEQAPEFAVASYDEGYPRCAKERLW